MLRFTSCTVRAGSGPVGCAMHTFSCYACDADRIIAEYDGSGALLRKFVHSPGIDEPICLINGRWSGKNKTGQSRGFSTLIGSPVPTDSPSLYGPISRLGNERRICLMLCGLQELCCW